MLPLVTAACLSAFGADRVVRTQDQLEDVLGTLDAGDIVWLAPSPTVDFEVAPQVLTDDVTIRAIGPRTVTLRHAATSNASMLTVSGVARLVMVGVDLDCNQRRCLEVEGSAELRLDDVRMFDGTADEGGLLHIDTTAAIDIDRSWFDEGTANQGGLIYIDDAGLVEITDSRFTDGAATQDGGGCIASRAALNVRRSVFDRCTSTQPPGSTGANGGALFFTSTSQQLSVTDTLFANSTAGESGGAVFMRGSGDIQNTVFCRNDAILRGGGLRMRTIRDLGEVVRVQNTLFLGNTAGQSGGALHLERMESDDGATFIVEDTQFVDNLASNGAQQMVFVDDIDEHGPSTTQMSGLSFFEQGAVDTSEPAAQAVHSIDVQSGWAFPERTTDPGVVPFAEQLAFVNIATADPQLSGASTSGLAVLGDCDPADWHPTGPLDWAFGNVGAVPGGFIDNDQDGHTIPLDCNDDDPLAFPGSQATETDCTRDLNCNGVFGEDAWTTFYVDGDGDGEGDLDHAVEACELGPLMSDNALDCNDEDPLNDCMDTDTDTDTDADSDTDADMDTDSDTDTDVDSDTDADTDSDEDTDAQSPAPTPVPPGIVCGCAHPDGGFSGLLRSAWLLSLPLLAAAGRRRRAQNR